jgi:hypothetical protein
MSEELPVASLIDEPSMYTTEYGAAFQGDSNNLLKELPTNSIDLIVPCFATG